MFWKKELTKLEVEIDRALRDLNRHEIDSEEYGKTLDRVIALHKMREEEKSPSLSKDTLAVVAANLLGILVVVKHEHVNVIMSRAMSLLLSPRIRS